jgi:hypothetical protein
LPEEAASRRHLGGDQLPNVAEQHCHKANPGRVLNAEVKVMLD